MKAPFLLLIALPLLMNICFAQQRNLFVGTYTQSGSHGIYIVAMDEASGKLSLVDSMKANNPSYLVQSPKGKLVYAIDEISGQTGGDVTAYSFDPSTKKMEFINRQSSGGDHPCFVDVHPKGKWVAVANYSGGSVSFLSVNKMGGLNAPAQNILYTGTGPNKRRQEKPHVHQSIFSHKGKFVWVTDLGTDAVRRYAFNPKQLQPVDSASFMLLPPVAGSGPRHIAVHPKQSIVYVLGELNGEVMVYSYSGNEATMIQSIKSDTISKQAGSADIHMSPDGKFLYASNRAEAHNIAIFKINAKDGTLQTVGYQSTKGMEPRNFTIHPSGKWLLAANQKTNQIVVFARNESTGMLSETSEVLNVQSPVCLKFSN